MSERYRIPKSRIPVELRSRGGSAEKGYLFLGDGRNGPESVPELLNGSSRFLVVEDERGSIAFHRLGQLAMVTLSDGEAFAEHGGVEVAADLATEAELLLEFDDGSRLAGVVVYALCESRARVQDFLNTVDDFFPLFHDRMVSYVNKTQIARVSPRESRKD